MIRNERQLRVSQKNLRDVHAARHEADEESRKVYDELARELDDDISEYLAVRNGVTNVFCVQGIDQLGDALTKARVARGLTHEQLAFELEFSEQMVQRDEAGGYERAGLARLAEIA